MWTDSEILLATKSPMWGIYLGISNAWIHNLSHGNLLGYRFYNICTTVDISLSMLRTSHTSRMRGRVADTASSLLFHCMHLTWDLELASYQNHCPYEYEWALSFHQRYSIAMKAKHTAKTRPHQWQFFDGFEQYSIQFNAWFNKIDLA